MQDYIDQAENKDVFLDNLKKSIRITATSIGIITVLIGLIYSCILFDYILDILKNPEGFKPILSKWANVMGEMKMSPNDIPYALIMTFIIIGAGTLILCWLALNIMLTGAKIVLWTISDKEAIRRLLKDAFKNKILNPKITPKKDPTDIE